MTPNWALSRVGATSVDLCPRKKSRYSPQYHWLVEFLCSNEDCFFENGLCFCHHREYKVVFFVIPTEQVAVVRSNNRKDNYHNGKRNLCVDLPIPGQCVATLTLSRPQVLMSLTTKIILEIPCKMSWELRLLQLSLAGGPSVLWWTVPAKKCKGMSV